MYDAVRGAHVCVDDDSVIVRAHVYVCVRCCMYLDLRNASWCWWDACQFEFAELVVVLCHGSLSLEHLDEYSWLVVLVCGECLTLLCWDNSVSERKKREGEGVRGRVI